MNPAASSSTVRKLMLATCLMVGAQALYAVVNFSYDVITNAWNPMLADAKMSSSAAVFWQYLVATLFVVPLMMRIGLDKLKTRHPFLHELRALASALGAQVFVFGFASGVPVWQMIGLLLTGPFFVIAGSVIFLGERLSPARIGASATAFAGALLIVGFGTDGFTWASLLPVLAAALWSATTVISKYLLRTESVASLTLYLLLLIVANHAVIGLALGVVAVTLPGLLPASLSTGLDLGLPHGAAVWWVLFLGLITAATQYMLWAAYARADATYLQPFDDLKLPLNTLLGWVLLAQVPSELFWPGAALIFGASVYVTAREGRRRMERTQAPLAEEAVLP